MLQSLRVRPETGNGVPDRSGHAAPADAYPWVASAHDTDTPNLPPCLPPARDITNVMLTKMMQSGLAFKRMAARFFRVIYGGALAPAP